VDVLIDNIVRRPEFLPADDARPKIDRLVRVYPS